MGTTATPATQGTMLRLAILLVAASVAAPIALVIFRETLAALLAASIGTLVASGLLTGLALAALLVLVWRSSARARATEA